MNIEGNKTDALEKRHYVSMDKTRNNLLPIFVDMEAMSVLIIGGGDVALYKLREIMINSPNANISIVSEVISDELISLITEYLVSYSKRKYTFDDIAEADFIFVASDNEEENIAIGEYCRAKGKMIHLVEDRVFSNFHMGSVVQRGNLKFSISTNGKSKAVANKLKEVFEEAIPAEIDDALLNMDFLRTDMPDRIQQLNDITEVLADREIVPEEDKKNKYRKLAYSSAIVALLVVGFLIGRYLTLDNYNATTQWIGNNVTSDIFLFILGGFIAQMIDGALGMAYGISATTFLLSFGVTPAAASASVHASEVVTTMVSGISHLKFGNVNTKLFKTLVIPGVIGAILGAYILVALEEYANYITPIVALYTLIMGVVIINKALQKKVKKRKIKKMGWIAGAGGFLDSIGGGGWGPIVTSTLLASGRNPRYTIGSVNLTEAFVAVSSSLTFILFLGLTNFQVILGLIIGGSIAAPISANLFRKLPIKTMMIVVGIVVILLSLKNISRFL